MKALLHGFFLSSESHILIGCKRRYSFKDVIFYCFKNHLFEKNKTISFNKNIFNVTKVTVTDGL